MATPFHQGHCSVYRTLMLALLLFILPGQGNAQSADAADTTFNDASAKANQGDFTGALEGYNLVLEHDPTAVQAWIYRAVVKWQLKDPSGARADLAQAINLDPENPEAYQFRASFRMQQKDWKGARADLEKAISFAPDNALLYEMRGEVQLGLQEWFPALADFERSLELDPENIPARYLRGITLRQVGKNEEALAEFDRVVDRVPNYGNAYSQRAWLRFEQLNWTGVIEDAEKIFNLTPDEALAGRVVGYALFGQGNYADSATTLFNAARLVQGNADQAAFVLFIRHLALKRLGKPDDQLAKAFTSWKGKPWVEGIGRFLTGVINEDEFEAMVEQASNAEERNGRTCEANFYIGMTRLLAGDRSTARLRFQTAVATGKTSFIEHTLAKAELIKLKP